VRNADPALGRGRCRQVLPWLLVPAAALAVSGLTIFAYLGFWRNALVLAASSGNLRRAEDALRVGVNPDVRGIAKWYEFLYRRTSGGRTGLPTPLELAVERGDAPMVRLLVAYRADVEVRDTYGRTPLIRAAIQGDEAVAHILLLAGAKPSALGPNNWTAIEWLNAMVTFTGDAPKYRRLRVMLLRAEQKNGAEPSVNGRGN
jgi:hypothetical protein